MEVIVGRYRLDAILGSGGMGEVWAAWDQVDAQKVAVKLFTGAREDDVQRARFLREAERTRSIHHPNVVHCFDVGEAADGRLYLVMEFIEGESLAQLLKREGALAMERAVRLAQQLCSGCCRRCTTRGWCTAT